MSIKPLITRICVCLACTVATAAILGFYLDASMGRPITFITPLATLALVAIASFAIAPDKRALAEAGCNGMVFGLALFLIHLYTTSPTLVAWQIDYLIWHAHILSVGFAAFAFVGCTAAAGWAINQGLTLLVRHRARSKIKRR